MNREYHRGDHRGALVDEPLQYAEGNEDRAQMQRQVHQVIPGRAAAAEPVIEPEGEVGEGARLQRTPDLPPAAGRGQRGVRQNGEVVQVERPGQRGAEGRQYRSLAQCYYVKPWPALFPL